jgi:hypothetical protein
MVWVVVVLVDILSDRHDQLLHIAKDPAAEAVLSEIAEESLHHVEPRATGRREVDVESRATGKLRIVTARRCKGNCSGDFPQPKNRATKKGGHRCARVLIICSIENSPRPVWRA